MIIDFHTHIFPDRIADKTIEALSGVSNICPASDGTAEGLSQSMARAGIGLSVNLPVLTRPEQADKVNDSLIRSRTEKSAGNTLGFCVEKKPAEQEAAHSFNDLIDQVTPEDIRKYGVIP